MSKKRTASMHLSVMVEYDPDATNPDAVVSSLAAILSSAPDVMHENGCGEVEFTHLTIARQRRVHMARPSAWDTQVVDLRVEMVRRIGAMLGIPADEDGRYDSLADNVLGIGDDFMWEMMEDLNLGYELDGAWVLAEGEAELLAKEIIHRYVELDT